MQEDWCHSWGCGAAAWPLWQEHVPLRSGCCCDSRWCHSSGQPGQLLQGGQPHCTINVTTPRSPPLYSRSSGGEMCEDVCIRNWDKTCFLGCHSMEWLNVWPIEMERGKARERQDNVCSFPSFGICLFMFTSAHPPERGTAGCFNHP